jgi:zinc protease
MKIISALFLMSTALLFAEPVKVDGFTHVRTVGGIDEYTLDANGMRVLLLPQKSVPVVTFMITYHVGSRHEVTGTTGATHLLEHLMFKGTAKYNRSLGTGFDQMLERVGAETNATTWLDRTNYFATVPSNALPLLVELEADRMRNLILADEDRKPEMTVVRNEFERGENDPRSALDKEIWAAAFMAHPYHHDTIGWRSDIERVPIEKLRAFYDTFYWPNNATATLIGDFESGKALALIKEKYAVIPKSPHAFPEIYTEEPEQSAQRRVGIKRAGELGVVSVAHKIPRATDADWPAVQVLSAVLTEGKTSRLYRSLTDQNLTTDVSAHCAFNFDPTLHTIYAELADGAKHSDVEKRIFADIEAIKKNGVTSAEVASAVAGLLAERAFERDGTFALASMINECIAVGDWTLFTTLDDKFRAVTAADVQRVAKKYLLDRRSVVGWFEPEADEAVEPGKPAVVVKEEKFVQKEVLPPKPPEKELESPAPTSLAKSVIRETVAGADLMVLQTAVKDIVTIHGSIPAGESVAKDRAIANLAAGMLERGTMKRGEFEIAELLENAGAQIDFRAENDTLEFNAKCLAKDLPLVLELLAEQMRYPALKAKDFEKLKKQMASELQMTLDDTNTQAGVAFSQAAYPIGHPNRRSGVAELIGHEVRGRRRCRRCKGEIDFRAALWRVGFPAADAAGSSHSSR